MVEHVCSYRWHASRVDTVHPSVPVEHVCALVDDHESAVHICACGASTARDEGG